MGVFTTRTLPSLAMDFGKFREFGDRTSCRLDDWGSFALADQLILAEVVGLTVVWMLVAAMTKVALGQVADGAATYKLSG